MCNLTEINVNNIVDQEDLENRARAAAFIGTLQASYTDFHYLRPQWQTNCERDALLGVSMTGIASQDVLELDMKSAANVVKQENARVAALINIKPAARCTAVKPAGTTSLVLGTSSGIHAWHNDYYIRRLRVGKNESIYRHLKTNHPELVEDEYFSPHDTAVICVPQKAPDDPPGLIFYFIWKGFWMIRAVCGVIRAVWGRFWAALGCFWQVFGMVRQVFGMFLRLFCNKLINYERQTDTRLHTLQRGDQLVH